MILFIGFSLTPWHTYYCNIRYNVVLEVFIYLQMFKYYNFLPSIFQTENITSPKRVIIMILIGNTYNNSNLKSLNSILKLSRTFTH